MVKVEASQGDVVIANGLRDGEGVSERGHHGSHAETCDVMQPGVWLSPLLSLAFNYGFVD